jgi:small-conductance mechanosensitive channel
MNALLERLDVNAQRIVFGNPVEDWFYALVLGIGTFIVLLFIRRLVHGRARRYARSADLPRGVRLVSTLVGRTQIATLFALSITVGSKYLELGHHAEKLTTGLIIVLVGLQVGIWASAALQFYLGESRGHGHSATSATTINIVEFVARGLIWTLILLVTLDNLGVNISAALTGLGIGGVAVALALQNILGDLFASLSIAFDKPFVVGDTIAVDAFTGTVESVGVKSTRLRSVTGEQLVVANADLLKSRLRNWGRIGFRRRVFTFRVAYDTSIDKLRELPEVVRALVEAEPQARFERCSLRNLGDAALEYEVAFVSEDPTFEHLLRVEESVYLGILAALAGRGIEIPVASTVAVPTRV